MRPMTGKIGLASLQKLRGINTDIAAFWLLE